MDKYGLLGFPLKHSSSMGYFNEKFNAEKIDATYQNFEIPSIDLVLDIVNDPNLCGLNVTIPYKEAVIPFLDELDEEAAKIGAVNVIKITRNKGKVKLKGYNSDMIGFMRSIEPHIQEGQRKALVLGTGGAAKAIYFALKQLGISPKYVSRTPEEGEFSYEQLTPEVMDEYRVVVNCTPIGMYPNVDLCPDIPYHLLTKEHLLYDLLYNPSNTLFMKKGKQQGATVLNGLEMLLLQAFAAWEIWQK